MRRWTQTMRAVKERLMTGVPSYDQRRALQASVRNREISQADADDIARDLWPEQIEDDGYITVHPKQSPASILPRPIGGGLTQPSDLRKRPGEGGGSGDPSSPAQSDDRRDHPEGD